MILVGKFFPSRFIKGAALGLLLVLLLACEREPKPVHLNGFTMGTSYHVMVVPDTHTSKAALARDLEQLLQLFNQVASTYSEDSELSQLNRAAVGEWHTVSPPLWDVLFAAFEVSWLTGGAFDATVGPLVNLWGFGPEGRMEQVPASELIEETLERVGFGHLQLDLQEPRVRKQRDVYIDLSGIAKGYGVDVVAEWLEGQGFTRYLVEIGGDLRVRGLSPRDDEWRIGIEAPQAVSGDIQQAIRITDVSVATSGDYRNYTEIDGEVYAHIIDPRTGWPVRDGLASITVLASTAAQADGLATGFSVMGAAAALQLAEQYDIPLYLIEKTEEGYRASHSSAFEPYLEKTVE